MVVDGRVREVGGAGGLCLSGDGFAFFRMSVVMLGTTSVLPSKCSSI